jgi:hypothetical protein
MPGSTLLSSSKVSTTSPVEGWHSVLKSKAVTKSQLSNFSLLGIVKHVMANAKDWDRRAAKVQSSFRTRQSALVVDHHQLGVFPYPVQELLAPEIRAAVDRC